MGRQPDRHCLPRAPCFYCKKTKPLLYPLDHSVTATHLLVEVQTGPLPPLTAHAARVGQLAEPSAVAQSPLVAVASARHAHAEHLHVSLNRGGKKGKQNREKTCAPAEAIKLNLGVSFLCSAMYKRFQW